MPVPPFRYQEPFPLGKDATHYRLLTKDFVTTSTFADREILKVDPAALAYLANHAMRDCSFLLREKHLKQVAAILDDPLAS
jgi:fumarate hydratase class I